MNKRGMQCQWGECDARVGVLVVVPYPDDSELLVCPDCEPVAKAEAKHLAREAEREYAWAGTSDLGDYEAACLASDHNTD